MKTKMIRIVVVFTEEEVALLDAAVATLNRKPGRRATRSAVVRVGTVNYASQIADDEARELLVEKTMREGPGASSR